MSFLRIRSPYHEPRDIPLGPSVGRRTASRLGIRGGGPPIIVGALVVGVSNRIGHDDGRRGRASVIREPAPKPTCGKPLRIIGGTCARRPGHRWDCQSAERMARVAEGKRTGLGRWP